MVAKRFISFEGIDGSGKSSQVKHLAAYLSAQGNQVKTSREPYGDEVRALLHKHAGDYTPLAQLFLLAAARAQHCEKLIQPALAQGAYVISDRFTDSTLAYQGYGLGLSLEMIEEQNHLATRGLKPDIVFIMDIEVSVMFARLKARGLELSSYERLGKDFFERVRQGYLEIAKKHARYCVIDASQSEQTIAAIIKEAF